MQAIYRSLRGGRHGARWVAVFFVVLTLVGVLTCADYGQNFDAVMEQRILKMNIHEYSYQILGEEHPFTQYMAWKEHRRISTHFDREHGQSAFYLAAPLLKMETYARDWFRPVWNAYTFLVFMAGVWAIYAFFKNLGASRMLSATASLLMYLTPRFFAEGHYNTKDLAVLSLMLVTVWQGLRFLKKPSLLRGLCFSFVGAMATNTRVVGLLAWGVVGICAIIQRFAKRDWSLRMAGVAFATIAGYVGFFLLLTPAAWPDILGHLNYTLETSVKYGVWSANVLYRGALTNPSITPFSWDYIPNLILLTLPLYMLPLAAIGQIATVRELFRHKARFFQDEKKLMLLVATFLWMCPLLYWLIVRPLVYNSWRHFYFLYAGIVLLAGYGIAYLSKLLSRKKMLKRAGIVALSLCLATSALGIALNHPYQYGYYNLLAKRPLEDYYDLDFWEVSTVSAMRKLYDMREELPYPLLIGGGEYLTTSSLKGEMILPYAMRLALDVQKTGEAPYMLYNTTYSVVYDAPYPPEGYHELFRIESYGNTLCIMYEKDFE